MTQPATQPAAPVQPPATEPTPPATAEHMIPKSRLDAEIDRRKELESKLAAAEQASRQAEEERLKEAQNYKALYEKTSTELAELKPKAAIAEDSEKVLRDVLATQVAELPEHMRDLVPEDLTTQQKLAWLSKHKAQLVKPKAPDIGAGRQGGGAPDSGAELSQEEIDTAKRFGMKPEEYAAYKDKA